MQIRKSFAFVAFSKMKTVDRVGGFLREQRQLRAAMSASLTLRTLPKCCDKAGAVSAPTPGMEEQF